MKTFPNNVHRATFDASGQVGHLMRSLVIALIVGVLGPLRGLRTGPPVR